MCTHTHISSSAIILRREQQHSTRRHRHHHHRRRHRDLFKIPSQNLQPNDVRYVPPSARGFWTLPGDGGVRLVAIQILSYHLHTHTLTHKHTAAYMVQKISSHPFLFVYRNGGDRHREPTDQTALGRGQKRHASALFRPSFASHQEPVTAANTSSLSNVVFFFAKKGRRGLEMDFV